MILSSREPKKVLEIETLNKWENMYSTYFFLIFNEVFSKGTLKKIVCENEGIANLLKISINWQLNFLLSTSSFHWKESKSCFYLCLFNFFAPPPQKKYIEKRDFDSILQYAWIDFRVKEKHIVGEGWWWWRGCGLWWGLPSGSFQNDLSGMGKYFLPPTII